MDNRLLDPPDPSGRMMFYVTKAANDGAHWTMIEGEGSVSSQGISNAQVRYGGKKRAAPHGELRQHRQKERLLAALGHPDAPKWACMEWYFDGATNTQKFWLDGKAIDDLTVVGEGEGCIDQGTGGKWLFPTFARVNLGWGTT